MHVDIAAEMVAAGGKWLDAHAPTKWWDMVDLSRLDIADGGFCVLGQVFKAEGRTGYDWALENLPGLSIPLRYEMGFSYPYNYNDPEDFSWAMIALNEAWRQYINARRIAAQEPWIHGQLVNDLAVSLGQMARGEGVVARTRAEELASV